MVALIKKTKAEYEARMLDPAISESAKRACEHETFVKHFRAAATAALDFARKFISEPLPDAMCFRVRLNCSHDANLHLDERVYPEDGTYERAHELRHCTEAEVVAVLWRVGAVPEWVNVSVVGVTGAETLLKLDCCGRFTSNQKLLYHQIYGHPPFEVVGPNLPVGYKDGDRFSIWRRTELWSRDDLERVRPHVQKVWSLALLGNTFDDHTLNSLPEFPHMEILALKHSPIHGEGLPALSRHPMLRVMGIDLAEPELFQLNNVPTFPLLKTLSIGGLPSRPCGLDGLLSNLPHLESLTLESSGNIFLDAPISSASQFLGITAKNIRGEVRLPREVQMLSLHLGESTALDLGRLLRGVEKVKSLHLRGTPVDDRFAEEMLSRFALEYIDLVGTLVSSDGLRRLAQTHPDLRMDPNLKHRTA